VKSGIKKEPGPSRGLPARWRRRRNLAAIAAVLLVAVLAYPAHLYARADLIDAWWLAARFTVREALAPPLKPDPDIVLLVLDDRCIEQWPEPTIAWNPHLGRAIDRLTKSGARAIVMDWLQPNSTDKWFPGNDDALMQPLTRASNVVWVMQAKRSGSQYGWTRPFPPFYQVEPDALAEPESRLGFAEFGANESVIDSASPTLPGDPHVVSLAARAVERAYGRASVTSAQAWRVPGAVSVPLREDGTILIDYANGTGRADFGDHDERYRPFQTISLYDLASGPDRADERFRNKIVLIGITWTGDNDQHFVPFLAGGTGRRLAHGVEVQANIVRNLLHGRPLAEPGPTARWLLAVAAAALAAGLFARLRWLAAAVWIVVAALCWIAASFIAFAGMHAALPVNLPLGALAVSGSLVGGWLALTEERERREVLALWGQYQDPRMVGFLLENEKARGGQGQEMRVTVLFADLKNFTRTVEHLTPTAAIGALNRYLGMLDSVIRRNSGIVDKYLGDGLMAQWGAPDLPGEAGVADHAAAAVRACLEIQREALALRDSPAGGDAVTFELRLTLHTGPVVFGWVGATRLELTIIGDTVNVTSRLQETAKQLDAEFLISEETYRDAGALVTVGKVAEVEIRGRTAPLKVYEVTGAAHGPAAVHALALPTQRDR
jgi:adenylate cyclase